MSPILAGDPSTGVESADARPRPIFSVPWTSVFPGSANDGPFFEMDGFDGPITYFVGRNGSGKSRTARAIANQLPNARMLSTDRLVGLMDFNNYPWGPEVKDSKGIPLDADSRSQVRNRSKQSGVANDELYALREQGDVWLRVAAFIRKALGRVVELRESSGYLDPYVRIGEIEYSLMREEGHGLREVVVLLAAIYREDWETLIVDEPELHLHPSLARLWLTEVERECVSTSRRAIVVTHQPALIKPSTAEDLRSVWVFQRAKSPVRIYDQFSESENDRVSASVTENPDLVSGLVFSPRPVLVEGTLDVAALTTTLRAVASSEVVAQTDLIFCGGNQALALWFKIASSLGIDFRAIGDLDNLFDNTVVNVMDSRADVVARYASELDTQPATTRTALEQLVQAMALAKVQKDPKSRSSWLAQLTVKSAEGHTSRRDKILAIWRDAGFWLHHEGNLEAVLGVDTKHRTVIVSAAKTSHALDPAARWAAYDLDPNGDLRVLVQAMVERVAHGIIEAIGTQPGSLYHMPVGSSREVDAQLVSISPVGMGGRHRLTMVKPAQFADQWVEFDRDTPASQLTLRPPDQAL